jgi:hypothetical protein
MQTLDQNGHANEGVWQAIKQKQQKNTKAGKPIKARQSKRWLAVYICA